MEPIGAVIGPIQSGELSFEWEEPLGLALLDVD